MPDAVKRMMDRGSFIIGDRGFETWIRDDFLDSKKGEREIALRERNPVLKISPKQVLSNVAFAYDVLMRDLRKSCSEESNELRSVAVYLLRNIAGKPSREIAKWVGASDEYAVAKIQERFKGRLKKDKSMRGRLSEIQMSTCR